MSVLVWIGWAVLMAWIFRACWKDADAADRREFEDEALRRFGPMD